jgi:hypothetical protein
MTQPWKHQPTEELLRSLGAEPNLFGEYTLAMDVWLRQREIIASSLAGVGYKRWPLVVVTFSCGQCGKPTQGRASEIEKKLRKGRTAIFCSQSCATLAMNLSWGHKQWHCHGCGKPLPSKDQHPSYYCSENCRSGAYKRYAIAKITVPLRPCVVCGAIFRPQTNKTPGLCCSRQCQAARHSKMMLGTNNPGFRHGISRYGVARQWEKVKKLIRERDGSKCVACGTMYPLDVHHINIIPTDQRLENLVCLCREHHVALHAGERSKPKMMLFPWLSEYAVEKTAMFLMSKSRELSVSLLAASLFTIAS